MTLTIPLSAALEERLRKLAELEGRSMEAVASTFLATMPEPKPAVDGIPSDWIDHEFHAQCEAEDYPDISLEEVRKALSVIPGKLSDDIIAEREERF